MPFFLFCRKVSTGWQQCQIVSPPIHLRYVIIARPHLASDPLDILQMICWGRFEPDFNWFQVLSCYPRMPIWIEFALICLWRVVSQVSVAASVAWCCHVLVRELSIASIVCLLVVHSLLSLLAVARQLATAGLYRYRRGVLGVTDSPY